MKRRLFIQINGIAVAAAVGLSACNDDTATPNNTTKPSGDGGSGGGGKHTIVIVPKDSTNPWFVRMEVGVKKYAADKGLDVYQKGPAATDATQQAGVIRSLIAEKVSALCVVPVDPGALEPVLKEAMDAGIVVVTHEGASQQNTQYDLEAFNNKAYGGFIMDNLAEGMGGEGLYTTMVGHVTNASHNEWADGGVEHQKQQYPNMKLLEAEPRVESQDDGEVAYQTAKELIKKYPDLKGIMGTSSFDAPGVARAIEELGLQGKFFTAGTGMPEANKQILEKGLVHALTLWDPADAGYAMAELARKILDKESLDAPINLGVKGYEEVKPSEGSEKVLEGAGWIVINKDNVDSFGF
ncbi:MAG: autoinducer 2 ABC transporter substrate-binding protein [Arachnia sp.]